MAKCYIENDSAKSLFDIKDKCINDSIKLPDYMPTLLNQINQWAHGSKPENVGQVSELIKEFRMQNNNPSLDDWVKFHKKKEGSSIKILKGRKNKQEIIVTMAGIEQGVNDILNKTADIVISCFDNAAKKDVLNLLKKNTTFTKGIEQWLQNLTYNKTYCGLIAQELILKDIADKKGMKAILGSPFDEQKGIDGYIIQGDDYYPLQIKSSTFKIQNKREKFPCPIVEYSLTKNKGIEYDFDDSKLVLPQDTDNWKELKKQLFKRLSPE